MLIQNQKSYYAIIPANVRYDEDLIPSAKLLYGEITALCNDQGFCWASNKYFSDLYKTNERTIRRWIQSLESKDYIRVELDKMSRYIYLVKGGQKSPIGGTEMSVKGGQKSPHNNTSNTIMNSIDIEKNNAKKIDNSLLFDIFWFEYPKRKRDRELCFKKFSSYNVELQKQIIDDVKLRKINHSDWVKNDHQFVPAPIVYLRGKRWEEEIDGKGSASGVSNVFKNKTNSAVEKVKAKMGK